MSQSKSEKFIDKLLRETIEGVSTEGHSSDFVDFFTYFQSRNNDELNSSTNLDVKLECVEISNTIAFLNENKILFVKGEYLQRINCFRFNFFNKVLDFPRNWSFLNMLYSGIVLGQKGVYCHFYQENDEDNLLKILPFPRESISDLIFFIEDNHIYCACFCKNEYNFLEKFFIEYSGFGRVARFSRVGAID